MKFILIYSTYKNAEEAEKIIKQLIEQGLIACGNFFPVTSYYKWKGNIESSTEVTAILKTRKNNWDGVKKHIEANHSYETPCIIKLEEVEANESFSSWIHAETKE